MPFQELDLALQPADLDLQCSVFREDLQHFFGQLTRHVLGLFEGLSGAFVFTLFFNRIQEQTPKITSSPEQVCTTQ